MFKCDDLRCYLDVKEWAYDNDRLNDNVPVMVFDSSKGEFVRLQKLKGKKHNRYVAQTLQRDGMIWTRVFFDDNTSLVSLTERI
jgi:hypothetical protein